MGPISNSSSLTAAEAGLVSCHSCRLLCRAGDQVKSGHPYCPRCHAPLHPRKPASLSRTWALVLAAMLLYIPANVLPITQTTSLGHTQSDTILSGVVYFMISGSWHIALIIFVASILVPLVKLVVLIYLLLSVQFKWLWRPRERTRLYRLTEAVGRWSMVDIYVVTVLVALVRMDALASVTAGPAGLYFAAVVVLTMLAADSFDPRLIWDTAKERK
ncbi:MAG: paraquat-inducible protein A [Desulfobacteraceae bacterium]|jgi:paraquat-inducible protein A